MELEKLNKAELLAKCEELASLNEKLTADLASAPKGSTKELQQQLAAKQEEIDALKGIVTDLNDKLRMADKTKGNANPTVTVDHQGKKLVLQTRHAVRKGGKDHSPKDIAANPELALELYIKKSTAVELVG